LRRRGDVRGKIKDPFVLEFLGLKDEYSETDLGGMPGHGAPSLVHAQARAAS